MRQKEPAPSAEVRRTTPEVACAPPDTSSYVAGVARERGRARLRRAAEQKQRAAYGDDEAAREAAGKAALLRAKKSLSTGWAARLCCEQRGRLAAVSSRLLGVRQRVQAVGSARKCARERATRERSGSQSSSVCLCGHSPKGAIARVLGPTQWSSIGGCCSRPRTNAEIIGVNARVPWANALLGVRMRVSRQRPRRGRAGPRACHRQSSEFEGRLEGGERDCLSRERGACRETAVGGKKFVKKVGGETVGKWNLHCPLWQGKNAWKIRV